MTKFDLDPSKQQQKLTVKLFKNVKNCDDLRKKLMSGKLDCCMIKSKLIPDPFLIVVAANKAICAEKLTTRTINTEILFNLSISKNISQSLQLFGADDKETDMYVATLNEDFDFGVIAGEEVDFGGCPVDRKLLQKTYKLKDYEMGEQLVAAICNKIVIKDFN
ncbi:PREDICTED: EKC/KEOPS complex subunit Tprkb-like [Nicrophorus vespilloides]|uniref:EKC/KEOPS complex subunit Tprkb-like n=1 Tax=Nicrophorus vespilloides TaxID=110193 RepID=A0ABM1NJ95_NICVS|nr:PREDICTED: EKC/KEOPS complex subunit Tprkb-like [Nicrophorus vespilloides]XP_017786896.1 PREDICTED: EKC/KEOPS complex subunit Tprkb-like [Nicrophorus vespilloides]